MDPAEAYGEYIGATLIEARGRRRARRRAARRPGGATRTSTTRTATRSWSTAAARSAWRRSATLPGSRSTTTPTSPGPGRSRATTSPDAAQPAVHRHPARRGRRAWATCWPTGGSPPDGHVAVAVGPGQGERIVEADPARRCANADVFTVRGGTLEAAGELQAELRGKNYDAVVGIGGGTTLDVAKYAATRLGAADGGGRDQPGPRRHRLAGQLAAARGRQGLVRRRPADRRGGRPRLRARRRRRGWSAPASATW